VGNRKAADELESLGKRMADEFSNWQLEVEECEKIEALARELEERKGKIEAGEIEWNFKAQEEMERIHVDEEEDEEEIAGRRRLKGKAVDRNPMELDLETLTKREELDQDWEWEDFDDQMKIRFRDSQSTLRGGFVEVESLKKEIEEKEKERKGKRKSRGRTTIHKNDEGKEIETRKGSERDERWNEVEFDVSFRKMRS